MHPFLAEFHARHPGATSRDFASGRGPDGRSSYQRLADAVQPGDAVLDLCCGDGFLIERIQARRAGRVTGIDASAAELAAASRRLGVAVGPSEGPVQLLLAHAQDLPLPDASVDLVVSHLAFMLLAPVEPVVAEIRRVLRPGGRFHAIVGGGLAAEDDAWARFVERLCTYPELDGAIPMGDPRAGSEAGLRSLFPDAELETIGLDVSGPADFVETCLMTCYDVDMLAPDRRAALLADTRLDLAAHTVNGTVSCFMRVTELRVKA